MQLNLMKIYFKMKCNSCLKEKEIYVNQICKECSDKMDKHIIKDKRGIVNCSDSPSLLYTIIILVLGLLVGFIIGGVFQQAYFIKGAVQVVEGLEGTEFNIEIDINETIMATTFFELINDTLQNELKEKTKQKVVNDRN
ncbi:hypothetical protein LCGC14_2353880 [marine sediment metagenome]|uniref:Uncharacterized protein n=1 Tax=marine sediment metagenome TaxID=412755 RepID=A0A0F9EL32_9ZZZZ